MDEKLRICGRTGCRWPAAASLSFRYDTRQAWLLDLSAEGDPNLYDLCPHHADALTVPRGWERVDRRSASPAPIEPLANLRKPARERAAPPRRVAASARRPAPRIRLEPAADRGSGGRYAALAHELPRLAAEHAEGRHHAQDAVAPGPSPGDRGRMPDAGRVAVPAGGEDERLPPPAPVAVDGLERRPSGAEEARGGTLGLGQDEFVKP
jgi:hypothetical protein